MNQIGSELDNVIPVHAEATQYLAEIIEDLFERRGEIIAAGDEHHRPAGNHTDMRIRALSRTRVFEIKVLDRFSRWIRAPRIYSSVS